MSGFPTTAWTVVSRARSGVDSEAREALAFLCAAYWLPLYSFARRLGHASEDALDLTQGYFALLIEKDSCCTVRRLKTCGRSSPGSCRSRLRSARRCAALSYSRPCSPSTSSKTSGSSTIEGRTRHRRLEIIHESLLTAWPRLARWRDQDAAGARLRDQLRQAAQLWDDRGRPIDLLWSDPSFAEYVVWKSRYPGRLTALEQSFGGAMEAHAGRRLLRMRLGIGAAFAALIIVLAIVSQLWIWSRASEQRAVQQTLRTEAQQLFALGQLEEDGNPTLAFAHALAALERADTAEIRRFALRQLWKGPLAFVRSEGSNGGDSSLSFSTDREWLVDSGTDARVWRRDGSGPFDVGSSFVGNVTAQFASEGRRLVIFGRRRSGAAGVDVLGLPELTLLKRIESLGT